jgi:predicted 3-demethylubiquinone-9 3-methyltransferase (glyoxalase superfamily)
MITAAHPFLMLQGQGREALDFYAATVPGLTVTMLEPAPDGTVARARFAIAGLEVMAFDSPPVHDFSFTPSTSIFLSVDGPEAVDPLADALAEGGKVLMGADAYPFAARYAWVQDRFGVSWQISAA